MNVYGYCRVSTERQADEGLSLPVQERTINGYAAMLGLAVTHVFVERGVSGSKPLRERPRGAELIGAMRKGDVLIVPKLDRAFRSALDALSMLDHFRRHGMELHIVDLGGSVTGGGISQLVFTVLSAVAENERQMTVTRIRDIKTAQRSDGRYLGGRLPWAMTVDGEGALRPDPERVEAVRLARELARSGTPYRRIAMRLNAMGFRVTEPTVKRIVLDGDDM